jgi:hypothetical protein
MRWLPGVVIATLASVVMAGLLAIILWAIWPGVMAYAAPLSCPGAFPDPFVQEHVYSVPGETSWSWSLLCMSPHGAIHRPGQSLPFALAVAILWLPCMAVGLSICAAMSRAHRQPAR